jgi:3-carboxy-cis,cis-muconate cycloisomerase
MLEWHALPQICMVCGRALQLASSMVTRMQALPERMRENLEGRHGLVYAEAISLRLAAQIPRDEAQARVKQLCADAIEQGANLVSLIAREYPDIDWTSVATPLAQLGDAPEQAHRFAARVRKL